MNTTSTPPTSLPLATLHVTTQIIDASATIHKTALRHIFNALPGMTEEKRAAALEDLETDSKALYDLTQGARTQLAAADNERHAAAASAPSLN